MLGNEQYLQPDKWVERYADALYAFALMRLHNEALAEDLVQDTFLSALKAKDNFQHNAQEKTWLVSILKNKIIDHYRKASTRYEVKIDNKDDDGGLEHFFDADGDWKGHWTDANEPKEWNSDFSTTMEREEFQSILQRCMGKLPKKTAAVFTMKYIDDEETETICNDLGVSSSNYWVIIHRAKLQLRECLEKNWFVKI